VREVAGPAIVVARELRVESESNRTCFREESRIALYYLACARHPAFGYIDHPPLSVWILQAMRAAFGEVLWTASAGGVSGRGGGDLERGRLRRGRRTRALWPELSLPRVIFWHTGYWLWAPADFNGVTTVLSVDVASIWPKERGLR
jgi:hypothetical protein